MGRGYVIVYLEEGLLRMLDNYARVSKKSRSRIVAEALKKFFSEEEVLPPGYVEVLPLDWVAAQKYKRFTRKHREPVKVLA